MKNITTYGSSFGLALAFGFSPLPVSAAVPAGQDELRIYPGDAHRPGESVVSISGRWATDDGLQTGFTALTFLNGPDRPKPDTAQSVAKKVAASVNRGMAELGGSLRGLLVQLDKNAERPNFIIKNKEGYLLSKLTVRNFINDEYTSETGAESFGQQGIKISFDVAESAAVAKVVINYSISDSKAFRAEGGGIDVTIGDGETATVDTKGKSTAEIEQALASKLGGKFSSSPLFPDEREKVDPRNIRPFDGGEVQIESMTAKSFTVEVKDPSLGMINRYQFRESGTGGGGWW
jgi:hypothetical protein